MKRIIYLILAALSCLLCFVGCTEDAETSSTSSEVKQSSIEFAQNEITLSIGDSVQAEVITSKNNVYIFWSIRDENIATISDSGVITAVTEGQTICYASFGGETVMCLVKVTAVSAKPMLSVSTPYPQEITLYVGDTLDLRAVAKLGDTIVENAEVAYSTNSEAVVSTAGSKLTACGVGVAEIKATATYEGQTAFICVTVNVVEK